MLNRQIRPSTSSTLHPLAVKLRERGENIHNHWLVTWHTDPQPHEQTNTCIHGSHDITRSTNGTLPPHTLQDLHTTGPCLRSYFSHPLVTPQARLTQILFQHRNKVRLDFREGPPPKYQRVESVSEGGIGPSRGPQDPHTGTRRVTGSRERPGD